MPAAQISYAETAAIVFRKLPTVPGFGLCTTFQDVPSQCSISATSVCVLSVIPTAQILFAEIAASPLRAFNSLPGFWLGTTVQDVPFQCSINEYSLLCFSRLLPYTPTAQMSVAES